MVWFLVRIFFLYKFHSLFFIFEIPVSGVAERFENILAFSLKLDLLFPIRHLLKRLFFVFLRKKKQIRSWHCNIFLSGGTVRKSSSILFKTRSWVVDFLESILAFSVKQYLVYSHQSLAGEWLFFVFFLKKSLCSRGELGLT